MNPTTHENWQRSHAVKTSSEKSFGLVFAGFFGLVALLPLVKNGSVRWWAVAVSAAFLTAALACPSLLKPLNRLWARFGLLLSKVTNPMVMGLLFYGVVTPIGLVMRALGKDPLRLKRDPVAPTYWIPREPPGPDPKTMIQQF